MIEEVNFGGLFSVFLETAASLGATFPCISGLEAISSFGILASLKLPVLPSSFSSLASPILAGVEIFRFRRITLFFLKIR